MANLTWKQEKQLIDCANETNEKLRGNEQEQPFIVLMRICRDYANTQFKPLLRGADREKWLIERLNNYRIKYFEKI